METKVIVYLIMAVLVLTVIAVFFMMFYKPSNDVVDFQIGCTNYCQQIEDQSESQGTNILSVAVEKAKSVENSDFAKACRNLYGVEYTWECWSKSCCKWSE